MGERFADSQSRAALWAGAVFSVGAHLVVGVMVAGHPGLGRGEGAERGDEPRARVFEPPAFRLGEDRGDPTAIAWLGYEEYRRHVAEPWLQDQAAFTPSASVPGPLPPGAEPVSPMPESRPESQADARPEPTPSDAESVREAPAVAESSMMPAVDPVEAAETVRAAADRAREMARDLAASTIAAIGEAGQSLVPPRPERVRPVAEAGVPVHEAVEVEQAEPRTVVASAEPEATVPERDGKEIQERSSEPARQVAERSPGSGLPGDVQDREAIAASIERAARVEWGQPLSAAGLRIETRAPRHITPLTRVTTRPREPVVRVFFGRDGRVREAVILRSSGHRSIDQPILDAVYEWTASGKPLTELDGTGNDATLAVDFRIAL